MRDNGCSGCKYEHLKGSEKPCCDCANMHMDKYEPITNADRIRNMSDEELTKNLCLLLDCRKCPTFKTCNAGSMCYANLLEWLQSEAE